MPMKIKAAVLEKMGAATPYEKSKLLAIQEVKLVPPGHGE
jgi:alcohol dehydrogenase